MQGPVFPAFLFAIALTGAPSAAEVPRPESVPEQKKAPGKAAPRAVADRPFGREGDARNVTRVIRIEMSDAMRFFPGEIRVKRGDTVRFSVRNTGELPHEFTLGTMDDLRRQSDRVKKNLPRDHGAVHTLRVEPGGSARVVWQFMKAGEFHYGCLVPGHFEAGMIGIIVVR